MCIDCCGLIQFIFGDPVVTAREAYKKITNQTNLGSGEIDETKPAGISPLLTRALCSLNEENIPGVRVVVLGRVNSFAVLYFLKMGCKVTAVDPSAPALRSLQDRCPSKSLTCVELPLERFSFPKDVAIVYADNTLSYCNPAAFKSLWHRAYLALKKDGLIVGSFCSRPSKQSWYIDKSSARAIFEDKNLHRRAVRGK